MNVSTIVNIILCILSTILAVISVVTVIITLRQNHKMIENATCPYITAYIEKIDIGSRSYYYIIVKNIGQSPALITEFSSSKDLACISLVKKLRPFSAIEGSTLAPGQSITCAYDYNKSLDIKEVDISVTYNSGIKTYKSVSHIGFLQFNQNVSIGNPQTTNKSITLEKELTNIADLIKDYIVRNL